jgi:hypothetical protein
MIVEEGQGQGRVRRGFGLRQHSLALWEASPTSARVGLSSFADSLAADGGGALAQKKIRILKAF